MHILDCKLPTSCLKYHSSSYNKQEGIFIMSAKHFAFIILCHITFSTIWSMQDSDMADPKTVEFEILGKCISYAPCFYINFPKYDKELRVYESKTIMRHNTTWQTYLFTTEQEATIKKLQELLSKDTAVEAFSYQYTHYNDGTEEMMGLKIFIKGLGKPDKDYSSTDKAEGSLIASHAKKFYSTLQPSLTLEFKKLSLGNK